MSPLAILLITVPLLAAIAGIAVMVIKAISDQPKWRRIELPGFHVQLSGDIDDPIVADALLKALEALAAVWSHSAMLKAITDNDLRLFVMPAESWLNIGGVLVGGEQDGKYLKLNHSLTSLCHELTHFFQWKLDGIADSDAAHARWNAAIWNADNVYRLALKGTP